LAEGIVQRVELAIKHVKRLCRHFNDTREVSIRAALNLNCKGGESFADVRFGLLTLALTEQGEVTTTGSCDDGACDGVLPSRFVKHHNGAAFTGPRRLTRSLGTDKFSR
jgi:hypothetical protein